MAAAVKFETQTKTSFRITPSYLNTIIERNSGPVIGYPRELKKFYQSLSDESKKNDAFSNNEFFDLLAIILNKSNKGGGINDIRLLMDFYFSDPFATHIVYEICLMYQSGELKTQLEETSLQSFVENVLAIIKASKLSKRILVPGKIANIFPWIFGIPVFKQALLNLDYFRTLLNSDDSKSQDGKIAIISYGLNKVENNDPLKYLSGPISTEAGVSLVSSYNRYCEEIALELEILCSEIGILGSDPESFNNIGSVLIKAVFNTETDFWFWSSTWILAELFSCEIDKKGNKNFGLGWQLYDKLKVNNATKIEFDAFMLNICIEARRDVFLKVIDKCATIPDQDTREKVILEICKTTKPIDYLKQLRKNPLEILSQPNVTASSSFTPPSSTYKIVFATTQIPAAVITVTTQSETGSSTEPSSAAEVPEPVVPKASAPQPKDPQLALFPAVPTVCIKPVAEPPKNNIANETVAKGDEAVACARLTS